MGGHSTNPPWPEHPKLREVAEAIEGAEVSAEILDRNLQIAFISSEAMLAFGLEPGDAGRFYGKSLVTRHLEDREVAGITDESAARWWEAMAPIMRHYVGPENDRYEEVFGPLSEAAAGVEPTDPPIAWHSRFEFLPDIPLSRTVLGGVHFLELEIRDSDGGFLGLLRFARSAIPESLLSRLGRGNTLHYQRMNRVSEPARREAAILFADLEGSTGISRLLSSRSYFEVVSGLTDLIDSAVVERRGIVGKHAGDGGSALFLAQEFEGSESQAVRSAIESARAIAAGGPALGPEDLGVAINIGIHWGSTLMVGQVATSGRLEVTALGDQMNECARIEAAAKNGSILASKEAIERLEPGDAAEAGIDLDSVSYRLLGKVDGAGEKSVRDAGSIPVTAI